MTAVKIVRPQNVKSGMLDGIPHVFSKIIKTMVNTFLNQWKKKTIMMIIFKL